jgi:large repetitive protein
VNDAPVIIGQTLLDTEEDTPISILVSHLTILDPDNSSGFTLFVLPGNNYTFSGNMITPALDFNGTVNVNIKISDGVAQSPTFILQIQVGDANDPPVITAQTPLSTNEDVEIAIELSHLSVTDPDNVYPNGFSVNVAPGNDYSVAGNIVKPAPNFFGNLTVPVNVNDGINNSALFNVSITVTALNDPPSFDPIPNQQVMENSGSHEITIANISKGPFEDTQSLVFFANSGNTKIVTDPVITYNGTAATAKLVYSVLPNVSGSVTLTVRAIDNAADAATFTTNFLVEVVEINATPTLDVLTEVTVSEDDPAQSIPLTGITAGIGETQQLVLTVTTANPEFFETLPQVIYQSPSATGTLQFKPKANVFGNTSITVTVTDDGSGTAPNVNTISRTFNLAILSVNDVPVFNTTPTLLAVLNEPYEYEIEIEDVEKENITFTFPQKPGWMNFTANGQHKGKLSGIPNVAGTSNVAIEAKDASGGTITQNFALKINTRPVLTPITVSTQEDVNIALPLATAFADNDGNLIAQVRLTKLPLSGVLKVNGQAVSSVSVIPMASLSSVIYEPGLNFSGRDSIRFSASDGLHYSLKDTYVLINIAAVNDPPIITIMETDTLKFEVNGKSDFITTLFEANDADDEMFSGADVAFIRNTYNPEADVLLFENTVNITGTFSQETGSLSLTGKASKSEYISAIRSIQYNHLNTVNPVLDVKTINISINDGKNLSNPKERLIALTYTFTDLVIPTGFTPNGDTFNDTWVITQPSPVLKGAQVKVFNKRGTIIYQSTGFADPWDGTFNGELLPPDTYFFTIDLNLPNKKTYQGFVTLLR